jgi:hypothetical protein
MEIVQPDFGAWLGETLVANGLKLSDLVRKSGQHYSDLNRLIHSGEKGRPIRPDPEKISVIVESLAQLGVSVNLAAALGIAGYRVAAKSASLHEGLSATDMDASISSPSFSGSPDFSPIFELLVGARQSGVLTPAVLGEIKSEVSKILDAARYRRMTGHEEMQRE